MSHSRTSLLFTIVAGLLLSASARAQADMSDQERRDAAKAEQRQAREDAERERWEEAAAAEAADERARLEALGADPEARPVEAERGFFIGLEAFLAEPSGAERSVARVGDIVTSATTAAELDTDGNRLPDAFSIQNERPLRLDYGGELMPRLELGWRRGTGAAFSVRYSSYSGDASAAASVRSVFPDAAGEPGLILGGIDNQGFENRPGSADSNPEGFRRPLGSPALPAGSGLHGASSVEASGSLDATRFDLLYTHSGVARPRLEMSYRVGLSALQVKRTEAATFLWESYPSTGVAADSLASESVSTSADAQAFGLVAGIAGRLGLTRSRKWNLRFGLELSGLTSEQDLAFRDAWVTTQTGAEPLLVVAQDSTSTPAKSLVTGIDADLGVEARLGARLRLGVGYRYQSLLEALAEESYPNAANGALLINEGIDLDFSGPYASLSWFF